MNVPNPLRVATAVRHVLAALAFATSLQGAGLHAQTTSLPAPPASPAADTVHVLDRKTGAFLDKLNSGGGKGLPDMTPAEARNWWNTFQGQLKGPLPAVDVARRSITAEGRKVALTIVRPAGVKAALPVVVFFHGGGWVMGNYAPTHERFVRELATRVRAAVVVVDYSLAPEHKYPVAVDESYAATQWIATHGREINVDGSRLAVAGGSVGGTMAAVVSLKAAERKTPRISYQALLWPITDADFKTPSYIEFAQGYFLSASAMEWLWDQYTTPTQRKDRFAAPLQATLQQMAGLPPALVQTAEYDIVRDEGEAYAHKMMQAGVEVSATRYLGTLHDFGLTNDLSATPPAQAAMRQLVDELKRHLAPAAVR